MLESIFTLQYSSYKLTTKTNQFHPSSEVYLEPDQTSMMERFAKIAPR